ncbi:cell division cycle-associated protein 3 [Phaenicophaeus curvirostris]|uniref:cell division cycle-associated protein 3 n=1 Tax=Phaenicophaeus curvirostris TaxID=33595 RepID=UPI0037F0B2AB
MGVTGSAPATPCNKLLAHVSDPRSPSAGILRTPIEVLSSPAGSPAPGPAAAAPERDPRSPTPGISRTPMRSEPSDSVDYLVKQLSEAFGAETPLAGATCPPEEPVVEEPALQSTPEAAAAPAREVEKPPSPSVAPARPARVAALSFSSGSKPARRKTNSKIVATTGGTSRSPLSILQDDNSPSTPVSRQGKRHVLGENLMEKKEVTVDLSRTLKSGSCAWSDLNKENQRCRFVEN